MRTRGTAPRRGVCRTLGLVLAGGGVLAVLAACSTPNEPAAAPSPTATAEVRADAAEASASVTQIETGREGVRADPELVHAAMSACVGEHGWTVTLNADGSISPGDPSLTGDPEFHTVWLECLADASIPHVPAGASAE